VEKHCGASYFAAVVCYGFGAFNAAKCSFFIDYCLLREPFLDSVLKFQNKNSVWRLHLDNICDVNIHWHRASLCQSCMFSVTLVQFLVLLW